MARITVYMPDEMKAQLDHLVGRAQQIGMTINLSMVCQKALERQCRIIEARLGQTERDYADND